MISGTKKNEKSVLMITMGRYKGWKRLFEKKFPDGYGGEACRLSAASSFVRKVNMKKSVYIMDVFAGTPGEGNPAGVVPIQRTEKEWTKEEMQRLAAELGFSETAFVRQSGERELAIRYFTPSSEIEMCGHATIASFLLLEKLGILSEGGYRLKTAEGDWNVRLDSGRAWIDFGLPEILQIVDEKRTVQLCKAMGITAEDLAPEMPSVIIKAGIPDIHMFVKSHDVLMKADMKSKMVADLSEEMQVTGVHMSWLEGFTGRPDEMFSIYASNFAPLYGIEEECATGTSNAGLTAALLKAGKIRSGDRCRIVQGEHMGRIGRINTEVQDAGGQPHVLVGGQAIMRSRPE